MQIAKTQIKARIDYVDDFFKRSLSLNLDLVPVSHKLYLEFFFSTSYQVQPLAFCFSTTKTHRFIIQFYEISEIFGTKN